MNLRWALALLLGLAAAAAQAVPTFAEVHAAYRPSDVTLLDRRGEPLQTVRVDRTVRRLDWVPLKAMSPALLRAIVLSEDRRFYEHSGVDWSAVAQSAWANLWNTRTRGASTLTMQLAGLLDEELARPAGGRSVGQKVSQAYTATRLDARWKKSEILEAYLNLVPFRGELVGIGALSQTLFGKHPSGLDVQEAAIAASLLRGPNASADTVANRACAVLRLQQQPCTGVVALTSSALVRRGGADVVVGNDGRDFDPVLGGELRRHLHVHVVAGIVAVEHDDTLAAVGLADGIVEALGGGRGKQFADGDRIQHVPAGIADEGRLMTRAAARHHADLAGKGGILGNDDARVFGQAHDVAMGLDEALHGILDHQVRVVDETLHDKSSHRMV